MASRINRQEGTPVISGYCSSDEGFLVQHLVPPGIGNIRIIVILSLFLVPEAGKVETAYLKVSFTKLFMIEFLSP